MTSDRLLLTVSIVCAFGAAFCAWQVRQAIRDTTDHDPTTPTAWGHVSEPALDDPELAAGCDRLRTAIHQHRKEEQL